MATMNFSIPDDVKEPFNAVFEGQNKSAVITRLMRRAIEEREQRAKQDEAFDSLVEELLRVRAQDPPLSDEEIRRFRSRGKALRLVIDASVAVKWVIRDPLVERDADKALAILRGMRASNHRGIPAAALGCRNTGYDRPRTPATYLPHVRHTVDTDVQRNGSAELLSTRCRYRNSRSTITCSTRSTTRVALEEGAVLVTADEAYFAKAQSLGGIQRLADFSA